MKCGAVGRAEMPSDGFFLRLSDNFTVEAVKWLKTQIRASEDYVRGFAKSKCL